MKTKNRPDLVTGLLEELSSRRKGRPLALFLDYDGTLVDIAPRPELARPDQALLELLARLAARRDMKVVVASGRPLENLQELLPVPNLGLVASHGGEVFVEGRGHSRLLTDTERESLGCWRRRLEDNLAAYPGWWLEDKPLGFALHYRQVPLAQRPSFLAICRRWRRQVEQEGRFQVLAGKMVLELMPLKVSKGAALLKILSTPGFLEVLALYLGDDQTDESAFELLRHEGLAVRVGRFRRKSAADHRLPSPRAVRRFLAQLLVLPEE